MKILLCLVMVLMGCSHFGNSKEIRQIKIIGDFSIASTYKFHNKPFGGLSGIVYNKNENIFFAISDDRSSFDYARIYKLKLTSFDPLEIKITKVIYLKDSNGKRFKKGNIDFEGITLLPNENILLSSESIDDGDIHFPPRLMEFSKDGSFIKNWIVKNRYHQKEGEGVRDNKSFESLVYKNGKVYTAVENALIQDDDEPSFDHDTKLRVLEYSKNKNYFTPCREFIKELSRLPVGSPDEKADTGLVEL
jgi:hypothetical protein